MKLTRFAHFPTATLGVLDIANGPTFFTIERPWMNNLPYVSCIPTGEYPLEWDTTGRIRHVPRLRDTAPRTQINIHVANRASELHGCIGVGMDWKVEGQGAMVVQSKAAMNLLKEVLGPPGHDGDPIGWTLKIVNFS